MDVKVEFQALGLSICVFYLRRNIVCPQSKEHFVVSIIERAKEVFLEKSDVWRSIYLQSLNIFYNTVSDFASLDFVLLDMQVRFLRLRPGNIR